MFIPFLTTNSSYYRFAQVFLKEDGSFQHWETCREMPTEPLLQDRQQAENLAEQAFHAFMDCYSDRDRDTMRCDAHVLNTETNKTVY